MFPNGLAAGPATLLLVLVSTVGMYLALIVFSRLSGLRSFAQMTNFDMAATVAFGSIVATTATSSSTSLLQGALALAVLFAVQALVGLVRFRHSAAKTVDSRPILLMSGPEILTENLTWSQMTHSDLRSKLRLAGITHYEQVAAVVLEATGEVSVLTASPANQPLELDLFASVRGRERLTSV
jgi:uncharacterized membrane protein YcaP (DUF421 family)